MCNGMMTNSTTATLFKVVSTKITFQCMDKMFMIFTAYVWPKPNCALVVFPLDKAHRDARKSPTKGKNLYK